MRIIIDVEEEGNKNEFIAEVEHFLKGGCTSGEVNEVYDGMPTKFKWKIEGCDLIKSEDKDRESIAEDKKVILNTPHYAIEVKETDEGVIVDIFHRHGDLIDTYTYWNDDVMEDKE